MFRLAAHYIRYQKEYRLHYLELDDTGRLQGVYPLTEEIAGTAFYNGALIPVLYTENICKETTLYDWERLTEKVDIGSVVCVYHKEREDLSPRLVFSPSL